MFEIIDGEYLRLFVDLSFKTLSVAAFLYASHRLYESKRKRHRKWIFVTGFLAAIALMSAADTAYKLQGYTSFKSVRNYENARDGKTDHVR